jgi:microcystin degradation protein MlrC
VSLLSLRSRSLLILALLAPALPGLAQKPRIAVGGFSHETNVFNPAATTLEDFQPFDRAAEVIERNAKASTTISGFIEGARLHGLELYPTVFANATPKGKVTTEAFDAITGELIQRLKQAPKLDGVLLSLHGAMVAEAHPHGDAEVVRRVREAMGPAFPIIVTHDFHANVSEEIIRYSTALNTFKLCPHLDPKERGIQAAKIMADTVSGKVKPVQAIVKPPMVYNIIYHDTNREPFKRFVEESIKLEQHPKVLAVSIPAGYQWGDVPAMGPSVIVVTDNDPELARREAQRLADMVWESRHNIVLKLPDPAAAVRQAMASDRFPVALVDTGDNIGGGSAGDSTFLLEELIEQNADGWVVTIADPEAVQAAFTAGVGGEFGMKVGGKMDRMHGNPVMVRGRVKALTDGRYMEPEVRHGGYRYHDLGRTAVIHVEGSTLDMPKILLVTDRRSSPNSIHQLTSNGVYPERMKILVVKGCIAPRAAYEPISRLIGVDSPGATAVNPKRFEFHHVRKGLWGMD